MARSLYASTTAANPRPAAIGGVGFDWAVALLGTWFIGGLYIDGWAHTHMRGLDTFFTPWHGILYAGFAAMAGFLLATAALNRRRGYSGRAAWPRGYNWSVAGMSLFALGGLGDLGWHTLFGVEKGVEALLSPTHLLLAVGGGVLALGPLRAGWRRNGSTARQLWPTILALTYLLALFSFFTDYPEPFTETLATERYNPLSPLGGVSEALGVAGILVHVALLMALVLLAIRRWGRLLPRGTFTVLIGLPIIGLTFMEDTHLTTGAVPLAAAGLAAGVLADGLFAALKPSPTRLGAMQTFAFAVPAILYSLYFLALQVAGGGVTWSVHLWLGCILLAGAVGGLLHWLMVLSGAAPLPTPL